MAGTHGEREVVGQGSKTKNDEDEMCGRGAGQKKAGKPTWREDPGEKRRVSAPEREGGVFVRLHLKWHVRDSVPDGQRRSLRENPPCPAKTESS